MALLVVLHGMALEQVPPTNADSVYLSRLGCLNGIRYSKSLAFVLGLSIIAVWVSLYDKKLGFSEKVSFGILYAITRLRNGFDNTIRVQ